VITVTVTALQDARRALGWSTRTIDFAGGSLEELLKDVGTQDGKTLFDFLVENDELRADYAVLVNGTNVSGPGAAGLLTELDENDHVVAMTIFRVAAGGWA